MVAEEISSAMVSLETQSININEQCGVLKENTNRLRSTRGQLKEATKPVIVIENVLDDATKQMGNMTNDEYFRLEKYEEARKYSKEAEEYSHILLQDLNTMRTIALKQQ